MAEEKEAPENEEGAPKKKSKLLLFAMLGVALLLLAGGGFFAYTTMLAPVEDEEPQDVAETIGEIFTLEPFVVNLADPTGKRYLKVQVEIELESALAVESAQRNTPRLRDNVIMLMTSLSFEEVMTPEGKIRIRDEMLERFNVVMRPDRVRNIYFTEFVVQ